MTRHLIKLEHLCSKLQTRYGAQDPLFAQVKGELDTCKARVATVPARHDWSVSYQKLVSDHKHGVIQRGRI
jgi:hypothetical protein